MTPVKLEPATPRSQVKHSTTELPPLLGNLWMGFHETYTEYMAIVRLCARSFNGLSSVIAELLPFDCLNFNDFFRPQPELGNLWMGFHETLHVLNIYGHGVVMNEKF